MLKMYGEGEEELTDVIHLLVPLVP